MSISTSGGTTFEALCKEEARSYACDYLLDLRRWREQGLIRTKKELINRVQEIMNSLQIEAGKGVEMFYIGKTFVRSSRRYGPRKFDPMKQHTWRKNGISSRWRSHRETPYGRDGLVVLGVVTRDSVPRGCTVKQEDYALALEQQLLHYYKIETGDERMANETFATGRQEEESSVGHALYMAYKLCDESPPSARASLETSSWSNDAEESEADEEELGNTSRRVRFANVTVMYYPEAEDAEDPGASDRSTIEQYPMERYAAEAKRSRSSSRGSTAEDSSFKKLEAMHPAAVDVTGASGFQINAATCTHPSITGKQEAMNPITTAMSTVSMTSGEIDDSILDSPSSSPSLLTPHPSCGSTSTAIDAGLAKGDPGHETPDIIYISTIVPSSPVHNPTCTFGRGPSHDCNTATAGSAPVVPSSSRMSDDGTIFTSCGSASIALTSTMNSRPTTVAGGGDFPPVSSPASLAGAVATTNLVCGYDRCCITTNRPCLYRCPNRNCTWCYHRKCYLDQGQPSQRQNTCGFEENCTSFYNIGVLWIKCSGCSKSFHKECIKKKLSDMKIVT